MLAKVLPRIMLERLKTTHYEMSKIAQAWTIMSIIIKQSLVPSGLDTVRIPVKIQRLSVPAPTPMTSCWKIAGTFSRRSSTSRTRTVISWRSETWPLTKPNLQRLQRNDRAMIRQICNVKPEDVATTRSNELLTLLGLEDLNLILKERRLRWYGHVERSSGAIKTALDMQVTGSRGKGRPRMTWKQVTERDRKDWKLSTTDPHDRNTWRSGVRSAMRAASQLAGRGSTDVDVAPVPAR
ncbi:hypothetical protein EGW08_009222 [Elysia chlorotica]|uniref:Uncharacterized protein n=1 Tax=Elysia chlorotica TaxID=188477 RepID=A0A3S0ZQ03_ELYCH|nr:hypothetical protein EGW08_009222 [Elysia chlorotica]